jgi:hypothetical protein
LPLFKNLSDADEKNQVAHLECEEFPMTVIADISVCESNVLQLLALCQNAYKCSIIQGEAHFMLKVALKVSMRLAVATTKSSMNSSSFEGEENNQDAPGRVPGATTIRFPVHWSRSLTATRCCAKPLATC